MRHNGEQATLLLPATPLLPLSPGRSGGVQGRALRPWPGYKSFTARMWDFLPDTGPTHYYQETLLHAALASADAFHYFNPWNALVYGTRATMEDHTVLSATLTELTELIGCTDRNWNTAVPLSASISRWNDSFRLTGSLVGAVGNASAGQPLGGLYAQVQVQAAVMVWRFTPSNLAGGASKNSPHSMVTPINTTGAPGVKIWPVYVLGDHTHPCSLVFEAASVLEPSNASTAPFGVWRTP